MVNRCSESFIGYFNILARANFSIHIVAIQSHYQSRNRVINHLQIYIIIGKRKWRDYCLP